MSRRSVLLATTFSVAIGSLTAVGPASAHGFGFGGFQGSQGFASFAARSPAFSSMSRAPMQSMNNSVSSMEGARFGHMPSMGGPAMGSYAMGSRMEPAHNFEPSRAPLANVGVSAMPSYMHPAQLSPSGFGARQTVDAAGILAAPVQGRINAAGIVSATPRYPIGQSGGAEQGLPARINSAETDGKLPKPGSTEGVPNVTGNPRIVGLGGASEHGPGSSGAKGDGPTTNLPGSQDLGQKGPRQVPGFGDATNGPQVNLPGAVDRRGPDAANKALADMENNDKQVVGAANQGGPNSENIPTSPGAGVAVSDDTSGKKSGSSGGSKPSGGGTSGGSASGSGKSGGAGNPLSVAPGVYGSGGTNKTSDGGTVTVSTIQDHGTTYQVVTEKDKDGNIKSMTYSERGKDGKTTTTSTGPEIPAKKNSTPSDDDTGTIGALNPSSGVGTTGHGGGTDNNGTETSVQSSQLANGTMLGRTGNGDGTGTHGDNNRGGTDGTLAVGTALARKDYGDGGGSDNRDGGTSMGGLKAGPGGGDPHQKAATAASRS